MARHPHHKHTIVEVPARISPALGMLLEAVRYAEQTSGDRWEFAVELEQLTSLGLTCNDFRWLVRKGFVEHQREITLENDDGRAFRPTGDLTFSKTTCFVLTDTGVSFAREFFLEGNAEVVLDGNFFWIEKGFGGKPSKPKWDQQRRELCIDKVTVKRFKWAAANQEAILNAFEEEGWPYRIDDPLPPHPEQDSKRRLSDTIKCLNRKQSNCLIRFRGDGSGEGVVWETVEGDGFNGKQIQEDIS